MKLHIPRCPECGEPARGTLERLHGCAEFTQPPANGQSVEYSGRTEVWWEEQWTLCQNDDVPEGPDNLPLVVCPNGHDWPTVIEW